MSVAWHLALPPVEIEENWWVNKEKTWQQDKQLDKHFTIFSPEWGGRLLVFLGMQPTNGSWPDLELSPLQTWQARQRA